MKVLPNPSFTRGEYWLLETAVELREPLCFVYGDEVDVMFNKPSHGLQRDALLDAIESLFLRGLVEASRIGNDTQTFSMSREEIEVALDAPGPVKKTSSGPIENTRCIFYQLTAAGGAAWESFAQPDWTKFIFSDPYYHPDDVGKRTSSYCVDKRLLEAYLQGLHYVDTIVDLESIVWSVQQPWHPTYWKELPSCHCASYCIKSEDYDSSWDKVPMHYYNDIYDPRWYNWK